MKAITPKGSRGRPKVALEDVRRSVSVRVNTGEWSIICSKAENAGMAPTAWMRQAALNRQPFRPIVPAVNRDTYAELARLAGNLNQLARAAHEGRVSFSPALFEQLRKKIQELRLELLGVSLDSQNH